MAIDQLQERLRQYDANRAEIGLLALEDHAEIISFVPEDMTVKVAAGISLAEVQSKLAEAGQWLPLDPADHSATIKQIIDGNLYGPCRYGYGAIREHLIGMEMILADGRLVQSGGNVVKNVAGYDLMKLFVGAHQSLGIVASATFKLQPVPERTVILRRKCEDSATVAQLTDQLVDSEVCPVVLDWFRTEPGRNVNLCIAFAGTGAEVDWQLQEVAEIGFEEVADMDYQRSQPPFKSTIKPSALRALVDELKDAPFVARAGNGVIWSDRSVGKPAPRPLDLERRLKETFDPHGLLPSLD
ncbi:MAG: FAD-binding oxidoreductase [Limisphaerales bacterium]